MLSKLLKRSLLVLAFPLLSTAFVVPGDVDYVYFPHAKQSVIFDKNQSDMAATYLRDSLSLHKDYEKSFGFNLTQTSYTTLASKQNQITNGFATMYPFLHTGFFSGGASEMDYFGSASWMNLLTLHELAHIYQLDAKHEVSKSFQTVLGNNGAPFINPNFLLPTLIIEGNAVMNESRYGVGGRLYVGQHRALVYALSKAGKLNYSRLLNRHLSFPYTTEKYLVGGYFWAYLAGKYGVDKANGYFYQHAHHYINPLRVNSSFEEQFGVDFKRSIEEFLKDLLSKSSKMKFLEGDVLSSAEFISDMNRIEDNIVWMQTKERGLNEKMSFSFKGLSRDRSSLSSGKLFKEKGVFYTASQQKTDQSHIVSGLFDADANILEKTKNFFYQDQRAGHTIALNIEASMQESKLYKDGKFYAVVESGSILDEDANVYYAKSKGKIRTIYKNKTPLFSFKGYTQKLLEFKEGKLWFIAPTKFGSSLFYFDGERVFRASQADNIVDARLINTQKFLAVAVTGTHYEVHKAQVEKILEIPAFYEYGFKEHHLSHTSVFIPKAQAYTPIKELKYAALYPLITTGTTGFEYDIQMDFMDPMGLNTASFRTVSFNDTHIQVLSYVNNKYPISMSTLIANVEENNSRIVANIALGTNLYETSQKLIQANISLESSDRANVDAQVQSDIFFLHKEYYGLSYDWYRYYKLTLANKFDSFAVSTAVKTSTVNQFFEGLFIKTNLAYIFSNENNIELSSNISALSQKSDQKMYDTSFYLLGSEIAYANIESSLAFKSGIYFDVFPLSLRQMSLFSGVSHYDYTFKSGNNGSFDEYYFGVEFELLGAHLLPFKTKLLSSYNTLSGFTSAFFSIALEF